ncbi:MAG: tubulin-like doman-containing protein [Fimbriiglobus sp.]
MPVRLVSDEELPGPLKGYRLIERLGRGGFGEVWKVEAPGGLFKAMKFVFGDLDAIDEDESRAAEQELKALNRVKTIRHPYILSLERIDRIEGQLIIVMELADKNLWDRFREYRGKNQAGIPRDELLRFMEEAAEALDLMNDHYQIQHLDVKPQNLFLLHNHVKVADFGLAKMFDGARGTITGGVTPVYAGPETFEGYVTRFTDQYSLAICYQELISGRRPFDGANTKQLLMQHLNAVPDLGSLSVEDAAVIGKALNKKPDDRWPSCMAMIAALKESKSVKPNSTTIPMPANRTKVETPLPNGVQQAAKATVQMGAVTMPATAKPVGVVAAPRLGNGSGVVGPLIRPTLVTPGMQGAARLVTPQNGVHTTPSPALTLLKDNRGVQTGRMNTLHIAPPERTGEGALQPAILVAVGTTGLAVLRSFRRAVREKFGSLDAVPIFRMLYLDTDPEALAAATTGPEALDSKDVYIAKLNRPSHYMQQSALNVESWFPQGLLYQLPKNPSAANGVRGFGRLAFCDHARSIIQRIRTEVESFVNEAALDEAAMKTGLGLRSNRAKAYVLGGLAGGSGGGMFLDLAYVLKQELRGIGYRKPEAVGILLAPPADSLSPKNLGLANTYAALGELHHFASGARYTAKFDPQDAPIQDSEGPFTRTSLFQLPKVPKPKLQAEVYTLAARTIFTELLTPVGRVVDYVRSVTPVTGNANVPVVQSGGLYRLNWPREEVVTLATQYFNRQLLARWGNKDTTHLKEPLTAWIDELWKKHSFGVEEVFQLFHKAVSEALRESPEAVFAAAIDTLRTRTPGHGRLDATAACAVLDQLLQLVGKPSGELETPGSLEAVISEMAKKRVTLADTELSALSVSFIEQPQYRIAGAEEALVQISVRLKATIEHLERQSIEVSKEIGNLYSRLFNSLGTLSQTGGLNALGGRKTSLTNEICELMQAYPNRRLLGIQIASALTLYRGVLGNIPEYIRDVNFCRTRLKEIRDKFPEPTTIASRFFGGKLILPEGCDSVSKAVEQIIDALPAEDLLNFDQSLQKQLTKNFRGLANLCLKSDRTDEFVTLLNQKTRAFLDARLERNDPATMLIRYHGMTADTAAMLRDAFEESASDITTLSGERPLEFTILALPSSPAAEQVKQLLQAITEGVEYIPANVSDDIIFIREYPRLEIARLPQTAAHAREAFEQQATPENPLVSRGDIRWTLPNPT